MTSPVSPQAKFSLTHHYASAADGSKISYYSAGTGPGIIVLHGAVCYALTHREIAELLSPFYTVHIVSRRGRGLSDGYPASVTYLNVLYEPKAKKTGNSTVNDNNDEDVFRFGDHTFPRTYNPAFTEAVLDCEVGDLDTLIAATGAKYVISVSSGALITLRALVTALSPTASSSFPNLKNISKAIIYEPPLWTPNRPTTFDLSSLARFERETTSGDKIGGMITAMVATQMGPSWLPRWILRILSNLGASSGEKAEKKRLAAGGEDRGTCTFMGLGGMLRYDFAVAEGSIGNAEKWRVLGKKEGEGGKGADILLLSGGLSPGYLKHGMEVLSEEIEGAKRVVVEGVGHGALGNPHFAGEAPKAVPSIREFLG
jgi:pimeloyl-ACP methyl ester carboxylesterase